MRIPRVSPLSNPDSGRPVSGHYVIHLPNGDDAFQSNGRIIAVRKPDGYLFDLTAEEQGKDTVKYLGVFTGMDREDRALARRIGLARRRDLNRPVPRTS